MKVLSVLTALLSGFSLLWAAKPTDLAIIGTAPISASTGIYFESATLTMPQMQAGVLPADFTIDLYSKVGNNAKLELKLQTTPDLTDGLGHTIPLTYSFTSLASGMTVSLLDNSWVEVIPNGNPSYRDGVSSPGFITISSAVLSTNQAAGSYTTGPIAVDVAIDSLPSTAIGYLTLNATVAEFIIVGFSDTSLETVGTKFIGETIDFGTLIPGVPVTPITKDLFIHTNLDTDIQITFANTEPLISAAAGSSPIPVTYSYSLNGITSTIVAGTPIVAYSGSNDGTASVGTITFAPDTPQNDQTTGAYTATINVVVSAM